MCVMRQKWAVFALAAVLSLCALGAAPARAAEPRTDPGGQTALPEAQIGLFWLTFEANGGQGRPPISMSIQPGQTITLPDAELTLYRDGTPLAFVGWAGQADASRPEFLPGSTITVQGSMTLYAVYADWMCQITYQIGGEAVVEEVRAGQTIQDVPQLPQGYLYWVDGGGQQVTPAGTQVWEDVTFTAYRPIPLKTQDHSKYMDGASDGLFHPGQSMTRAEAAQVLYRLLAQQPQEQVSYSDVAQGAWYAKAVGTLGALDVLDVPDGGAFRPAAAITRGEFAQMVSHFIPPVQAAVSFSDIPETHPAWQAIAAAVEQGLFTGYEDGTFRPDKALSRAEAVVVFNRLLGRQPDTAAIAKASNIRIFPDLAPGDWAYNQIMEATVSHTYTTNASTGGEVWGQITTETTALPDGYYRFDGWLYRVRSGVFLRSTTVDGFTYDSRGRYTTGLAELDTRLHQIIASKTNDSMSRNQKLRALYNYVRDNFTYLKRPLVSKGQTGWEPSYALEFLKLGKGNCYSFSAAFCLLARQLGLPARTVVGGLGRSASPHGWVEIALDGTNYMFDPQLEWRYRYDFGQPWYDLFMMLPSRAPFTYVR